MDDLTKEFIAESQEGLIRPEEGERLVGEIFCAVHTIKGTTGFLDFQRLEKLAHAGELVSLIVIASATARCRCAGRSSCSRLTNSSSVDAVFSAAGKEDCV